MVKIRKDRRCWGCYKSFPAGTLMHKTTHFEDGKPCHFYTCQPCENWIDSNTQDWERADWESLLPGDIGNARLEKFLAKATAP